MIAIRAALLTAVLGIAIIVVAMGFAHPAEAAAHHHHRHHIAWRGSSSGRPSAWCGWQMLQWHPAAGGRELWLARNWARVGRPTSPHVGAIVVWSHHVGEIAGQASKGMWIVRSGNDGHAVRERPRSISGAIAIRDI